MAAPRPVCEITASRAAKCFPGTEPDHWGGEGFSKCSVWDEATRTRRSADTKERFCFEKFVQVELTGFDLPDEFVLEKEGRVLYYPAGYGFMAPHADGVVSRSHIGTLVVLPPDTVEADRNGCLQTFGKVWHPNTPEGYTAVFLPLGVSHWVAASNLPVREDRFSLVVRVFEAGAADDDGEAVYEPSRPASSQWVVSAPEFIVERGQRVVPDAQPSAAGSRTAETAERFLRDMFPRMAGRPQFVYAPGSAPFSRQEQRPPFFLAEMHPSAHRSPAGCVGPADQVFPQPIPPFGMAGGPLPEDGFRISKLRNVLMDVVMEKRTFHLPWGSLSTTSSSSWNELIAAEFCAEFERSAATQELHARWVMDPKPSMRVMTTLALLMHSRSLIGTAGCVELVHAYGSCADDTSIGDARRTILRKTMAALIRHFGVVAALPGLEALLSDIASIIGFTMNAANFGEPRFGGPHFPPSRNLLSILRAIQTSMGEPKTQAEVVLLSEYGRFLGYDTWSTRDSFAVLLMAMWHEFMAVQYALGTNFNVEPLDLLRELIRMLLPSGESSGPAPVFYD